MKLSEVLEVVTLDEKIVVGDYMDREMFEGTVKFLRENVPADIMQSEVISIASMPTPYVCETVLKINVNYD